MRQVAALAVLAMLLGACGTGVTLAPDATVVAPSQASVPASPTPEPSPVTWSAEQAGAMYLKIVAPLNKAKRELNKAKLTLSAQKKAWKTVAAAADRFIDGLKAIPFPPEAADEAAALIKAEIVFQARALRASKAKNIARLNDLSEDAAKANSKVADAASLLRDALGLPPNA